MILTIYGMPNCSFCEKTKNLLNLKQVDYNYIEVTDREKLLEIAAKYNMKTVPIVVRGQELVGGYKELESYIQETT